MEIPIYFFCKVRMIDYGNEEDCEIGAIKKRVTLTDIPTIATRAKILGIKPVSIFLLKLLNFTVFVHFKEE